MAMLHNVLAPLVDGRTRTQGAPGTQFSTKARPDHWGTDLRANVYDTPGDDVHAPCEMTLIAAGIGDGTGSSRIPWHSGRFQYWDLGVWGGDRMYLYLGHLHAHVGGTAYGRTVKAGTHVAEMGGSGAGGSDKFVDHLHIGVAQNTPKPTGKLRNGKGWIDPVAWFAKHGVNFNSSPIAATTYSTSASTPLEDLMAKLDAEDKKYIEDQLGDLYDRILAGIKWAKIGYNDETLRTLLTGSYSADRAAYSNTVIQKSQLEALTQVTTEMTARTTPLTADDVQAMLKRIEDRAVDTIAADYEITKKEK